MCCGSGNKLPSGIICFSFLCLSVVDKIIYVSENLQNLPQWLQASTETSHTSINHPDPSLRPAHAHTPTHTHTHTHRKLSENIHTMKVWSQCINSALTSTVHSFFPASGFTHIHKPVVYFLSLSGSIQVIGCTLRHCCLCLCISTTSKVKPPLPNCLFLSVSPAPNARREHAFF